MGGPHVEYPCLACNYICDNPAQILNHYEKRHNIDLELRAENVHEETLGPQYGCPFCPFLCERDVDLVLVHYEKDHELYLRLDGENVVEDKTAKIEAELRKKAPSASSRSTGGGTAQIVRKYEEAGKQRRRRRTQSSSSSDSNHDGNGRSSPRINNRQTYRISGDILIKMYELTDLMRNVFHNE